ncbi:hypothetical protein BKN14_03500 [Candidatus Gracilibacteria bacterium HOT-871]|nr:hypothetical protein BKN14_03500 [Candidatus Gracilibacteria bacterium HOT-871]MBB1564725.1 DUF1304 domain-containing protein [Candidatus Gracilibacteria bacterium]
MEIFTKILITLVALEHFYILYIEMFAWETIGKKIFAGALEEKLFSVTKGLAANQGLYNGFLGVGLLWSLYMNDKNISLFFLGCIIVAGLYGAYKSSKSIFFKQALPAIITMIFTIIFL